MFIPLKGLCHQFRKNCSMRIPNMARAALFDHISAESNTIGLQEVNRAAPAIF
jgi:hypothetical protein